MAFRASSGRILVTDETDEIIIFDSNEKMFQATDRVIGTVTIPERRATFDGTFHDVDLDIYHPIASVNAHADTVVGAFKLTSSAPQGVAGLGWFNASGTYMHFISSGTGVTEGIARNDSLSCLMGFTFIANGGALMLHERTILQSQGTLRDIVTSVTVFSVTFYYNLYVGSFV